MTALHNHPVLQLRRVTALAVFCCSTALAQAPAAVATPATVTTAPASAASAAGTTAAGLLFAIEIKTGPAWDNNKAPQEQAHFREHSSHLRRLREQGVLVMGARYADKGLVVLRAASETDAHALMKDDPSVQAGVFKYELHEFRVFYNGTVAAPPRPR